MAKKLSLKNTKNEMLDAYEVLIKELTTLENQAKNAQKELDKAQQEKNKLQQLLANSPAQSGGTPQVQTKVVYEIPQVSEVADLIAYLNNVQQGISPALSEVSAKMSLEAEALADLQTTINNKKENLTKLYDLKVENGILDKLITEYEEKQAQHAEEQKKLQEAYHQDLTEKQKAWQKEQKIQQKLLTERNDKASLDYQRNVKEHDYELKLNRNTEKDSYEQKKKALQQILSDLREKQEETWNAQEKQVKDREDEFEKFKKEAEEIPNKLEKEIKKAEYEGRAIIEKEAKIKADLLAKEVENAQKVFEMKITALDNTIKGQESRIQTLNKQLETALKQVQDLAIRALEGTTSKPKTNLKRYNFLKEVI
jgi:hypothetical protein